MKGIGIFLANGSEVLGGKLAQLKRTSCLFQFGNEALDGTLAGPKNTGLLFQFSREFRIGEQANPESAGLLLQCSSEVRVGKLTRLKGVGLLMPRSSEVVVGTRLRFQYTSEFLVGDLARLKIQILRPSDLSSSVQAIAQLKRIVLRAVQAIDISRSELRTFATKRSNTSSGAIETYRKLLLKSADWSARERTEHWQMRNRPWKWDTSSGAVRRELVMSKGAGI